MRQHHLCKFYSFSCGSWARKLTGSALENYTKVAILIFEKLFIKCTAIFELQRRPLMEKSCTGLFAMVGKEYPEGGVE